MGPALLPRIARALLCAVVLLCEAPAQARHILDLDLRAQPAQLKDWGDYLIDERGDAPLRAVLARAREFKPTLPAANYPLRPGQSLWIRFTVPATPDDQRWYVRLPSPGLDLATLYTQGNDGSWSTQRAGDALPVSAWALPHLYPILPLSITAAEPTHYVLRVEASDGLNAPVEFVSESHLSWEQQRMSLVYGVYFGLLAMGAFFALATAVALRDAAYLWFGLWSAAATLTAATAVGIAGLQFWPETPVWSDAAHYVLPAASSVPFTLFVAQATLMRERAPRVFWCACALAAAGAACALLAGWTGSPVRLWLALGTVTATVLSAVAIVAWSWHRGGDRFARNLLFALAPVMLALPLQLGEAFPLLGPHERTLPLVLLALAVTLCASYLLLALRSQERRDHRRRIAQLHEVDPTTGLVNDTVFARRSQELAERAKRFEHQSVVAIVEFANLNALRNEFGRKEALELLLRLAERLHAMLRTMDTVARLADARFGLLIDGPVAPSRARAICAKVVAHCIMPMAGLPQGMVVKPRIALALVPGHGSDVAVVIARLDEMLRETADDPGRIIMMANGFATDPGMPESTPPPASEGPPTTPAGETGFQPTSASHDAGT